MFCQKCGHNNPDGAPFCSNCGSPMNAQQNFQFQYQQNVNFQALKPFIPGKGMGIAAMVLGIVACVFCCYFYISLPCAITGLILGCLSNCKAKKAGLKNGFAVAGIACSSVALGLTLIFILYVVLVFGTIFTALDGALEYGFDEDFYYAIRSNLNIFLG